jgi:hypothetical protein
MSLIEWEDMPQYSMIGRCAVPTRHTGRAPSGRRPGGCQTGAAPCGQRRNQIFTDPLRFDPDAGGVEPLMYGISVLHCLPAGRAEAPSAATGTVMRSGTLRAYAREAGFEDAEVLPIEHPLFRFYRLW